MKTVTKIINEIKGGYKFLIHRKFKLFLEEHKAVTQMSYFIVQFVDLVLRMFRNIFYDKKRRSPFPERNEQFKISRIYISSESYDISWKM